MKRWRQFDRGSAIAFAAIVGIVFLILLISIVQLLRNTTKQLNILQATDNAISVAETGLNRAIGRLAIGGTPITDGTWVTPAGVQGSYHNTFEEISTPFPCHYIRTDSAVDYGSTAFRATLHSYVRVSNVGDFFAAVYDELSIGEGANAEKGRVYSPTSLIFSPATVGNPTRVKAAEYYLECDPPPGDPQYVNGTIQISEPADHQPQKPKTRRLFPQVLDSDMDNFRSLAKMGTADAHNVCDFTGALWAHIFPPGYVGGQNGDDHYTKHSDFNEDHVYFCEGDMTIGDAGLSTRIIHGQVLFVASGSIHLRGNIISYTGTNPSDYPGAGFASSSTAHQAVFLTQNSVFISSTYWTTGAGALTQTIEGLVMAVNGELRTWGYNGDSSIHEAHTKLSLNFKGSLILQTLPSTAPHKITTVFGAGRTYSYMDSLATHPPPYLPAIAEIIYQFEEVN